MPKADENCIEFFGHPYDKNHLFICFEACGFPELFYYFFIYTIFQEGFTFS